jgi:hypothetical protein
MTQKVNGAMNAIDASCNSVFATPRLLLTSASIKKNHKKTQREMMIDSVETFFMSGFSHLHCYNIIEHIEPLRRVEGF